jgi:hypothetical protein
MKLHSAGIRKPLNESKIVSRYLKLIQKKWYVFRSRIDTK